MKKSVRSPGSATVINAIATGFGAAFGIGLDIKCCANTQNSSITCSNDVGAPTTLMEICAKKTFEKYEISPDDFGINIKTESELPMASGLSSSSALSNAVVSISSKIIAEEFNLMPLDDLEIINLAIDASLEAKVTITGSFDDATASYFGGVVVTDNKNRKFIIKMTVFYCSLFVVTSCGSCRRLVKYVSMNFYACLFFKKRHKIGKIERRLL